MGLPTPPIMVLPYQEHKKQNITGAQTLFQNFLFQWEVQATLHYTVCMYDGTASVHVLINNIDSLELQKDVLYL